MKLNKQNSNDKFSISRKINYVHHLTKRFFLLSLKTRISNHFGMVSPGGSSSSSRVIGSLEIVGRG
jgi:hypothetical protein